MSSFLHSIKLGVTRARPDAFCGRLCPHENGTAITRHGTIIEKDSREGGSTSDGNLMTLPRNYRHRQDCQ
jgi:hypothetical protein